MAICATPKIYNNKNLSMWRKYGKHLIEITEICMPSLVQTSQKANGTAITKIHLIGIVCVVVLWLPSCGLHMKGWMQQNPKTENKPLEAENTEIQCKILPFLSNL